MKNFRFIPFLATFLVAPIAALADEPVVLRTLTGDVPALTRTIQAENMSGRVTITAVAENFGWEWTLRSSDRQTARAQAYAQECRLDVHEANGVLQLRLVRPEAEGKDRGSGALRGFLSVITLGAVSGREAHLQSDLTLRVPATSAIDVNNRHGTVSVKGTRNAVGIDCRNGRIDLSDIGGAVTARTSFATIRAENIGPAQLTSQNGSIEARGVDGDLRVTTSFGRMRVSEVKGSAILKNQNGAIAASRVTGDLTATTSFAEVRAEEIGGRADVKAQNSHVDAGGVTGEVTVTNSFGALRVHDLGSRAVLKNQNGAIEAMRVTGDLIAATSFAHLRAEEIGGRAELECRNGKIDATRVTGGLRAINSFAALRVRDIGGSAELAGQNSEIAATGVRGDIDAKTSFGRLQLDGSGRRFVARNQNGAVEIVARSADVQQIVATASFAPIDLRLPDDAKPLIRATTSFGKVRSDFPVLNGDTVSDARFAADATPLKVSLKGQNGDIRIQTIAAR